MYPLLIFKKSGMLRKSRKCFENGLNLCPIPIDSLLDYLLHFLVDLLVAFHVSIIRPFVLKVGLRFLQVLTAEKGGKF
jgi:hypothetical protein